MAAAAIRVSNPFLGSSLPTYSTRCIISALREEGKNVLTGLGTTTTRACFAFLLMISAQEGDRAITQSAECRTNFHAQRGVFSNKDSSLAACTWIITRLPK